MWKRGSLTLPGSRVDRPGRVTSAAAPGRLAHLAGFDNAGELFIYEGRVLRGIHRDHASTVRRVLSICEANDLFSHGIIQTHQVSKIPISLLQYEMLLEHEHLPIVSYPHEWSASMFKEAALLHVALFERLQKHGLTLNEWTPLNIMFAGTRPVFVDFTSIVPIDVLSAEHRPEAASPKWFAGMWDDTSKAIYEIYRTTYVPHFALPLAMMDLGHPARARQRVYETTLNTGKDRITKNEVFRDSLVARMKYELENLRFQFLLREKGPLKNQFFKAIRHSIASRKVATSARPHSTYYEDASQDFPWEPDDSWTNKQLSVYEALTRFQPATVLDLGSSTGWFSMLAAKLGSKVVAVDLDESSVDRLFAEARRERMDILPLVANLVRPLPPVNAGVYPDERLRSEMVLALAIVHHLALGQSHSFDEIAATLGKLSTKYLLVEFVDLTDEMIASDRTFFPAYNTAPDSFTWYLKENLITALKWHFAEIEEMPSHPATRTLLLCRRT